MQIRFAWDGAYTHPSCAVRWRTVGRRCRRRHNYPPTPSGTGRGTERHLHAHCYLPAQVIHVVHMHGLEINKRATMTGMDPPLKIQDIHPMLFQCWASVADAGSTLIQHWADVSRFLGQRRIPHGSPLLLILRSHVATSRGQVCQSLRLTATSVIPQSTQLTFVPLQRWNTFLDAMDHSGLLMLDKCHKWLS